MQRLLFVLVLLVSGFAQTTFAEEVRFATVEWPPYVGEALDAQGFVAEIVETAWEKSGNDFSLKFLPMKRAITSTRKGLFIAMFPFFSELTRQQESFLLSAPFAGTALVFFKQKAAPQIVYRTLMDLVGYKIGIVRGFTYNLDFDGADYLRKEASSSVKSNFLKLMRGRVDLVLADKYVADVLFRTELKKMSDAIEQLDPPFAVRPIYVAFSKQNSKAEEMLRDFNKGLREIKRDGTLEGIMRKHGYFTISSQSLTPADVEALVSEANRFIGQVGMEKAMLELKKRDGKFSRGELYVFAINMKGDCIAHIDPKLSGKNIYQIRDQLGFPIVRRFIDVVKLKESGWVEYWWENPITKKIQPKITYVQRVNSNLFLGCGIYR